MTDYIERTDALVRHGRDPRTVVETVSVYLEVLLRQRAVLDQCHREPDPDRYRQHILYVHPEGAYSIVSLVWTPGQATPIHDHHCWCVVGVLDGVEHETQFHLIADRTDEWLLVTSDRLNEAKSVCPLMPPDENIHRVENATQGTSISIHVYGADIAQLGSSIHRVFDLPLLERLPNGVKSVAWRER
jgi:predicted metal-dependent enzyme (double-stranded beta helix superfamily)